MKRIIGLVLVVLAIVGTVGVIRNSSQGAATPATGNSAYDSGRQAGKKTAPVVLVVMGLVGLWLLLKSDDEMRPAAPQRQAPAARSPTLRAGQNTFASNPALLRLNTGQWLAANSWVLIVSSCFAIAGVVFLFIKLPVAIVLLITAIILIVRKTRQARQKFFMGDVCPGVVLYAEQNLVAVFTDLKAGGNAARPAVKILKQPLHRFTTEPAYDGMRVAAAALYYGNVRQAAWQDFSPEVINCVVRDPEEIARVLGSIPEPAWQDLDNCLAQVAVAKPGLYRIWDASSAAGASQGETDFAPAKPWFKTTPAIIGLSVLGAIAALIVGLPVLGLVSRSMNHRNAISHRINPAPPPAMMNPPMMPSQPTQTGPFAVDGKVEANWAGGWIPGKITSIHPGGFTVMVQLDDSRFPMPIMFPTNRIRLK